MNFMWQFINCLMILPDIEGLMLFIWFYSINKIFYFPIQIVFFPLPSNSALVRQPCRLTTESNKINWNFKRENKHEKSLFSSQQSIWFFFIVVYKLKFIQHHSSYRHLLHLIYERHTWLCFMFHNKLIAVEYGGFYCFEHEVEKTL